MIDVDSDHSNRMGEARSQGLRPTCLAFAASDLNAVANRKGHLSVEFLCHHAAKLAVDWQPDHGFALEEVLGAVAAPGQPEEGDYPYVPDAPDTPLTAPSAHLAPLFASPTRARNLADDEVIRRVRAGEAVGVVVAVTQSLYYPKAGIVEFDPFVLPDLYHALIAVGLGTHATTGERHALVRNSWGTGWGLNGHAWISEKHLSLHLHEGFLL